MKPRTRHILLALAGASALLVLAPIFASAQRTDSPVRSGAATRAHGAEGADAYGVQSTAPAVAGRAVLWRAVARVCAFHRLLAAASADSTFPSVSMLFVDSHFWSRFAPGPNGLTIEWNLARPRAGDVVLATSEATLAAILEQRLPIAAALADGRIAVEGESDEARIVYSLLVASDELLSSSEASSQPLSKLLGPAPAPVLRERP